MALAAQAPRMSDLTRQELLSAIEAQEELPQAVKDCEKSIKEDNSDLSKEERIAICRDQLDLQDAGGCPEGQVLVGGECRDITESALPQARPLAQGRLLAQRRLAGPIEREERDDGSVVYRNIKVLTEGIWTDAKSRKPTHYVPENLDLEEGSALNLIHDRDNEVSEVGHIENEHHEDGDKYVDFVLHMDNAASEYADENLQATLESGGAKGFGGPSVEIPEDGLVIDPSGERGYPKTEAGKIAGVGLVRDQADKQVSFARQTAERAVALADGSQNPIVYTLQDGRMSDATVPAETMLEALDTDVNDLELGDRDLADVPVTELVSLIAESYGADPADLMEALEPFLDGEGMENQEGEEDEGDEDEPEEPDDEPDEEDENDANVDIDMEDAQERIENLDERLSDIEDMVGSLMSESDLEDATEELADAETVDELTDAKEDLEKQLADAQERIEELEDQPKAPKTLADGASAEENGSDVSGPITEIEPSTRY